MKKSREERKGDERTRQEEKMQRKRGWKGRYKGKIRRRERQKEEMRTRRALTKLEKTKGDKTRQKKG